MTATDPLGEAHARRKHVRFWQAFIWLLIGAVVYAVALALMMLADPGNAIAPIVGPSLYLTPLFGLPYLVVSVRQRGWTRRAFYFLAIVPLAHVIANYLAWRHAMATFHVEIDGQEYFRNLATGAIGGFSGAVLSFSLLLSSGLAPRRRSTLAIVALAIPTLTAIGAIGVAHGIAFVGGLEPKVEPHRYVFWYECVHLPWQAAFAFFLAWLIRIGRRPAQ